jgi:predicted transcriptional regulator
MDIKEIKKMQNELNSKVAKLMDEFSRKTGCKLVFHVETIYSLTNDGMTYQYDVKTAITL